MSIQIAWGSACIFAVVFCVILKPSKSQVCSTERMEDITIDVKAAFSKGIRGEDPIHTASWEACVNVCCLGTDKNKCNYVVFDARRKGSYLNCYLFYYPINETCPVRRILGLVTYKMIKDSKVPMPPSSSVKLSHPTVDGKFVSPLVAIFDPHSPTSPPYGSGPFQKPTASESLKMLSHLDEIDGQSQLLKVGTANNLESLDSSLMHELNSPNTVRPVIPIVQPSVKLSTVTIGTQASNFAGTVPHVSPRNTMASSSTTAYQKNIPVATTNSKRSPTIPNLSNTSGSTTSDLNQLLSSVPMKFSSASSHDTHLSNGQLSLEGYVPAGIPGKGYTPHFGDKSMLIAALLFGVISLLLVIIVVGRKMLESLQKKRYTRLDYLINGMYANM